MPPRIFHTNFRGPLGITLRTIFAQFSQTRGMVLKSASVQANNVSTFDTCLDSLCSGNLSIELTMCGSISTRLGNMLFVFCFAGILSQHTRAVVSSSSA